MNEKKSYDVLAAEYVKGVRESNPILTWELLETAFCAGAEVALRKNENKLPFTDNTLSK